MTEIYYAIKLCIIWMVNDKLDCLNMFSPCISSFLISFFQTNAVFTLGNTGIDMPRSGIAKHANVLKMMYVFSNIIILYFVHIRFDKYICIYAEMALTAAEKQRRYRARRDADLEKKQDNLRKDRVRWEQKF